MKYIKVKNNRLWNGLISVRSYIVDKAIAQGKGLEVTCNGVTQRIDDPKTGQWGQGFTSKFDGKKYRLVDYKWGQNANI